MRKMEKEVYQTLKKYKKPAAIEESDWQIISQCSEKDLVKISYVADFKSHMAMLTETGRYHLEQEDIRRHPLKRLGEKFDDFVLKYA